MKFLETTNLDKIKENMKLLARIIRPVDDMPFLVHNMFNNTAMTMIKSGNQLVKINLLNSDEFELWHKYFCKSIDNMTDLYQLYMTVQTSYKLTWLKFNKEIMSHDDFSEYLAQSWVDEENPNQDSNVSTKELVNYFRQAIPESLMCQEDLQVFRGVGDVVHLYRGVSQGRRMLGLSWTDNIEKAMWFAGRFQPQWQPLKVLEVDVNREDILAYLNIRGEQEFVIDVYKYSKAVKIVENELLIAQ